MEQTDNWDHRDRKAGPVELFAQALKDFRKRSHLNQEQLSECASYSRSAISKFECAERLPDQERGELLATCLRLDKEDRESFLHLLHLAWEAEHGEPVVVRDLPRAPFLHTTHERDEVLNYFRGRDDFRRRFEEVLETPSHALIAVRGEQSVGKSSLLRVFLERCRVRWVPAALVSADDAKSIYRILTLWVRELILESVTFPNFGERLQDYEKMRNSVFQQLQSIEDEQLVDTMYTLLGAGRVAFTPTDHASTVEAMGNAGQAGIDRVNTWLSTKLGFSKPRRERLLNPAQHDHELTRAFVEDLEEARAPRIVVMLDKVEDLQALEGWIRELVDSLPPLKVLFVLAGQKLPDWLSESDWTERVEIMELEWMTNLEIREAAKAYSRWMTGDVLDESALKSVVDDSFGRPLQAIWGANRYAIIAQTRRLSKYDD